MEKVRISNNQNEYHKIKTVNNQIKVLSKIKDK